MARAGGLPISELDTPDTAIVVNPIAGRGRGLDVGLSLVRRLQGAGRRPRLVPTEGPGHATAIARALDRRVTLVVVAGGDGTLRECAHGLGPRAREVVLGFVPLGNANVVARELGIPLDPERALDVVEHGVPRAIDTLRANGAFALAMAGVGYDGRVTAWIDAARRRRPWSLWYRRHADSLYGALGTAALVCRQRPWVSLWSDGCPAPHRYAGVVVSNLVTYAKGWSVTPAASAADGWLDWVGRRSERPDRVLAALAAARGRRILPSAHADYGRARRVVLRAPDAFPWQLDGDPRAPVRELVVEVGDPIRILAPRG